MLGSSGSCWVVTREMNTFAMVALNMSRVADRVGRPPQQPLKIDLHAFLDGFTPTRACRSDIADVGILCERNRVGK